MFCLRSRRRNGHESSSSASVFSGLRTIISRTGRWIKCNGRKVGALESSASPEPTTWASARTFPLPISPEHFEVELTVAQRRDDEPAAQVRRIGLVVAPAAEGTVGGGSHRLAQRPTAPQGRSPGDRPAPGPDSARRRGARLPDHRAELSLGRRQSRADSLALSGRQSLSGPLVACVQIAARNH